jgi:hypothetical protein
VDDDGGIAWGPVAYGRPPLVSVTALTFEPADFIHALTNLAEQDLDEAKRLLDMWENTIKETRERIIQAAFPSP